jgi:hypothetical protein
MFRGFRPLDPNLRRLVFANASLIALLVSGTATGAIVQHVVAPEATDPAISVALDDHYVTVNTTIPPDRDLFVFLPGTRGKPSDYLLILQEAASNGFRAVGLMYPDDNALYALCPVANTDPECWEKVREEIVTGNDVSSLVTVSRADSIENRLFKLLIYLDATYPSEGWGTWIIAGQPNWSRIRLAGWSQGGGHAAYMAKDRDVARVIGFSSPQDWDLRLNQPAPWITHQHVTPSSRYFGFGHIQDATALWSYVQPIWTALGMNSFGVPVSVDTAQPPYAGSHQLTTNLPLTVSGASFHKITVVDSATPKETDGSATYAPVWRTACFAKAASPATTWLLPSSARAFGTGGAVYTTDVTIANTGSADAVFTLKFLDHDTDGHAGLEKTLALASGKSVTYTDVLGSVFGVSSGYGAVRLSSSPAALVFLSQTWTPSPSGGTVGQSVPGFSDDEMIRPGITRSILAIREDAAFRTNLILSNASEAPLDVDVSLVSDTGATLGMKRYTLPALGMTQVTRVVRDLGVSTSVSGARLVLSTPTSGGVLAAYASVIDNPTNDPRTLLPK